MLRRVLKSIRILSAVVCLMQVYLSQAQAQSISSAGRDFYMGFLYPTFNSVIPAFSSGYFRIYALISSFTENTVYVSYFNPTTGKEEDPQPYKIQARQSLQIPLSVAKLRMTSPGDLIKEYRSVHIHARRPINVHFFTTGGSSGGEYLCLPTNGLGMKYVIGSYNDNPFSEGGMLGGRGPATLDVACGLFMVIGAYDSTVVTITPTSTTQGGKHIGVFFGEGSDEMPHPYTITLNRGQCYMVKSWCADNISDITGSTVESDKPVAVISGHENAFLGGVGGRSVEARDLMIEQMIPVEYWDSAGYVSLPFIDSSPLNAANEGVGDNYRVITYDTVLTDIRLQQADTTGMMFMDVQKYRAREAKRIQVPVNFYSPSRKKFLAYQLDQSDQGTKEPFPRPSMMQIIPISRWSNAYLWFVTSNIDVISQSYFINVIGPKGKSGTLLKDSIFVSINGDKEVKISSKLAERGIYTSIPGHPELMGARYKVTQGLYYARANFPFIIYNYGYRGIDSDGDLGDFDNDDNFFSYAAAAGMILATGDTANISILIDTLCDGWRICANDMKGNGIRSIMLLDDPEGNIVMPASTHTKPDDPNSIQYYASENVSFDLDDDPSRISEVNYGEFYSTRCVTLKMDKLDEKSYAAVMIADQFGNGKIIELRSGKRSFVTIPQSNSGIALGLVKAGTIIDTSLIFIHQDSSGRSLTLESLGFVKNDPAYRYELLKPVMLPAVIKPGDSVIIRLQIVVADTNDHIDSLFIRTDCFSMYWKLSFSGGIGIISASDHNFGSVVYKLARCVDTVTIRNIGKLPFTLDSSMTIQNSQFTFSGLSSPLGKTLPQVLQPNKSVKVRICYSPSLQRTDSTAIIWHTDIEAPYNTLGKPFSILRGNVIRLGIEWDRKEGRMRADSTTESKLRVFLMNTGDAMMRVDTVLLQGDDADEFRIIDQQLPTRRNFVIEKDSGLWFDIGFTPDMSKPEPKRSARRNAELVARAIDSIFVMTLIAGFDILKTDASQLMEFVTLHPNPTHSQAVLSIKVNEARSITISVTNILGDELYRTAYITSPGINEIIIPTAALSDGTYFIVINDGKTETTKKLLKK